jgi:hypothetical protein
MLLTRYQGVLVEVVKGGTFFLMKEINGERRWQVTREFGVESVSVIAVIPLAEEV